ncbi:DoxX family protein [Chitinophaga qingshengii]|uniref:DoxX family protein n=1 Tax=Chitinophaga qingshengii TaxID=1569794 RepID=A0ABR7TEV0_9BACT|nr:DoxX family protein [Chitinophaga qingshengii]MBC9928817.1 DoxX family protein [Chitinophaga qingshengii]
MDTLQKVVRWGDHHHPVWLSVVRMLLGLFLMAVGVLFIMNRDALDTLINTKPALVTVAFFIGHYIVFVHIVGGLFIAMGLETRFSAIVNIPVLLGALLFMHSRTALFQVYPVLGLSALVLVLLIVFAITGSGRLSVDEFMRRHPERKRNHTYIDF